MSPNVLNDALPDGGGLFTVVVENERINEARADADFAAAPVAASTTNALAAEATKNTPVAVATPNVPGASDTSYTLSSSDASNVTASETP